MANEIYTDPSAKADVLGLNSPENQQIASQIMEKGLGNTLNTGGGEGSEIPMGMPPTPQNDAAFAGAAGLPSPEESLKSIKRMMQEEVRADWVMRNADKKMPGSNMTWGEYFEQIYERAEEETPGSGKDAIDTVIDGIIKQEEIDADPNQQNVNMPQVPTLPLPGNETQMAAAAGNIAAAEGAPPMPPIPDQGGIMTAANGGVVGFNLGGMNQAPVSEEEFMNVLNAEAQTAGVSPDQMAAVTEMATNATGGPAAANDNVMDTGIMQNVEAVEATEEDLSGIGSLATMNEKLVEAGEEGLAHVSPGELIFDPSRLDEPAQRMLLAALETAGIDPAAATVGNEANILNQMTGLPAFGWFSRVWKKITKPVKKVGKFLKRNAGTILGIAGAMTGQPWLAALGSGIGSLIEGKPLGQALLSAGMSFAGTKWVGPWIGEQISGIAGSISPTAGAAVDAPVGDIFGGKMATLGAEGVAIKAAENAAAKAAAQAAIEGGLGASSEKLAIEAAKRSLAAASQRSLAASSQGLFSGAGLSNVTQGALDQSAQRIGQKVARDLASKAITTSLAATAPAYGGASSFLQSGLGRSIADVGGGITAGALQQATTPMIEASMFGDPNAEAEALAAWNERYNYTPSAQELYEFYTNEYIPNQQVDPGIIGGTPGYQTAAMGNLGMNFAPPPPPGTAGLLPNSLGIFNAAGGGYVNGIGGPRTDSNLARLSDGEFVMTEQAVRGAGNGDRADGAARMLGIMQGFERSAA